MIKGFPDYYITDNGAVYSRKTDKYHNLDGRIKKLKPFKSRNNYLIVNLSKDGKLYHKLVHRLVAEAFIENPFNKPEVNHIDGDTLNNCVKNLEFCTKSENELHKYRVLEKGHYLGKDNWNSKKILQIQDGEIINRFDCIRDAERDTGIKNTNIAACCKNKKGYKSAGSYQWQYALE